MVFGSVISSPRGNLSPHQVLDLANIYLDNARKATDLNITLVLCHDTEVSLSQVKRTAKHADDNVIRDGIATVYLGLAELLESQGHRVEAQTFFKKSEKLGGRTHDLDRPARSSRPTSFVQSIKSVLHSTADAPVDRSSPRPSSMSLHKQGDERGAEQGTQQRAEQKTDTATLSQNIFPTNVRPPTIEFNPPEPDSRLNDTHQLACCLGLLQSSYEFKDILDPAARKWLQLTKHEPDEKDRLKTLATDVIRAFKRDEFKDAKSVTEVVCLAPVLDKDDFRYLLKEFYSGIDQSGLLDVHQLEGIAHLVQGAHPGYLDTDDLVKVLGLLSTRLRDTHQQSTSHIYQLTLAVSHVLDAMADADVKGLDREKMHEPLSSYLDGLKNSTDAYLVYQAAYAYQALMCVPDDESLWQSTLRRTGKVVQGVSGLVSAVKGLDLNGFIDGLVSIQQGFAGASEMVQFVKSAYEGAVSLAEGGQGFFSCLKEGLSFNRKCAWYSALRGADTLIRDGQLCEFKKLVCSAPCRRDAAFQWGICQRLGQVAASPDWDTETRQGAVIFLGEIYRNDSVWGDQANVKQWILNILMQLTTIPGVEMQYTESLLQELGKNGNTTKQTLYRVCRDNGPGDHPLNAPLPPIGSSTLLDRVQQRPDVDGHLRHVRRQRLKSRGIVVYIPPQAKASLHAHDDTGFSLMEKVDEFLAGDQQVFLLLGDSGAGKSTFNRELEYNLWQSYKKNDPIPLHINLPAIDKPEHDMIAKQLRKCEFTEPQIRELKIHRKFVLICDGYDESQQTHNLYTSNKLNQLGEWNAKMVISCRSEYLGVDYRDRFQPGDRNNLSDSVLLQEAVITPFSMNQVQEYITQYVSVHRPLWEADEYRKALDHIPSLKELVKNPFLMSLSLEVLPRMVDPGQDLSVTHITRMALYDQFIEHWLERGKKRLGEKNLSPQSRSAYESLIDEGFTRNGIDYLKRLSVAIYREQGGQPIVGYSRYKDENTWKSEFFSREEEKQLLREACPLIRNGNQHRFIHRSLLEYGVSLAIFDPQDWKGQKAQKSALSLRMDRRGSASSVVSSDGHNLDDVPAVTEQGPSLKTPLAWRSFIKEPSVLQFLEERLQQEPLFKQQLLDYIEYSKNDKKWRTAASNSITILIRAGVHFTGAQLQGIRVPNADLSYGVFESAQLQGADLRHTDLRGVWLRKANLSNAQMSGAQFGELPFLKHDSYVTECLYSSDGEKIAVRLGDGKINIYSTSSWDSPWTSEGRRRATSIVYSPNGSQIAYGSEDGTVALWDVRTGGCLIIQGHDNYVTSVAFSPQGDRVASASYDRTVKLWDAGTGECRRIWIGDTSYVYQVIYSPNGNTIASSSEDSTVRLWNTETETWHHVLRGHDNSVTCIVYSPQGDQVASASYDKTVRLWDVTTGDFRHVLTGHTGRIYSVAYSPSGDQVASASEDMSVRLWDVTTGMCLHTLLGHSGFVSRAIYSPQGDTVASVSGDYTVRLWDTETGACRQTLTGHTSSIQSVAFSPKGDQVASGSHDATVRLWDVGAGTSRHTASGHGSSIEMVDCSPTSSDHVVTCSGDRTVKIWDIEVGVCIQTLRGHSGSVRRVAYSPQGDQIATGSDDYTIRLWNVETGACIHSLTGHSNWIWSIAYSPQGDQLVSSSSDRTARLWDVRSGECTHVLRGHTSGVARVMYLQSGNQVISGSWDSTLRIWDVESGACKHTLSGHNSSINDIALSPQEDQVASAGDDMTVRVWDVATGECRHIFIGHNTTIYSIAYSPRGDQIISGDEDGSIRVWDTEARSCLSFTGHSGVVNRIVYSSQGDLVVSASKDRAVRLWDVTSGQCRAVIQESQGVNDIAWIESSGVNYLMTGCSDGVIGMWQVKVDGGQCHVSLRRRVTKGELSVMDATVQDVQGLNQLNKQLLKQRGAVGEPLHRLREAGKKVMSMASVVSKLKAPSDKAEEEDVAVKANTSEEHLEQPVEPLKDLQLRGILSTFVRDIHGYL